ncbi:11348_t:CDS:1, partial [Cetraspora pellucida]
LGLSIIIEKSSRSSVNKLSVGGSSVNRLLVRTSISWSLLVVGGSSVSKSLGIRSSVRTLDGKSLVNRTSVGDDILGYDSTSEKRTFNMNDTNNNKSKQQTVKKQNELHLQRLKKLKFVVYEREIIPNLHLQTNLKLANQQS